MSHDIDPRPEPGDLGRWQAAKAILLHDAENPRSLPDEPFLRVGLEVERASSVREAIAKCTALEPQLVFLPLNVGGVSASRLLNHCLSRQPAPVVVVVASHDEINAAAEAMRAGAFDCLFLPFSPGRLAKTIEAAVKAMPGPVATPAAPLVVDPEQGSAAHDRTARVLTASQEMRVLHEQARTLAASRAPVIVSGEVGTGKSLFAREIHVASARGSAPVITLDAPTLTTEKLERAALAEATGGTLVIEEICELDASLQTRLLALIDGPIGQTEAPRILATTRHNPRQAIRDGRLRPALYYRLNVATIALPPLRGRGDDIALIARTRLAEFARAEGREITGFSNTALDCLTAYDWPGNVRELVNLVWSLVLTGQHPLIAPAALPEEIVNPDHARATDQHGLQPGTDEAGLIGLPLAEIERRVIEATIRAEGGSVPRAARVLDVSPSTLYRKRENWTDKP